MTKVQYYCDRCERETTQDSRFRIEVKSISGNIIRNDRELFREVCTRCWNEIQTAIKPVVASEKERQITRC